jgi:hypothetical protein
MHNCVEGGGRMSIPLLAEVPAFKSMILMTNPLRTQAIFLVFYEKNE